MSEATRHAAVPASTVQPTDRGRQGPLDWQRLLPLAAIVECVAVLVVAAILGDLEAALIGLGFGVGLALLRWRQGVLGRLAIGLLSANVLAWMALGTYSHLVEGSGLRGLLIPGLLTSLSLVGVLAAVVVAHLRSFSSSTISASTTSSSASACWVPVSAPGAPVSPVAACWA